MCLLVGPTAAVYELLKKKSRLFSFGSNNAFLEFFLDGVPGLLQTQMDSKKVREHFLLTLSMHVRENYRTCFVSLYSVCLSISWSHFLHYKQSLRHIRIKKAENASFLSEKLIMTYTSVIVCLFSTLVLFIITFSDFHSHPMYVKAQYNLLQEVDVQLKAVCEKFISDMSSTLTTPVKDFLAKCDVIFQLAEKDHLDPANILHQQPFAKAGMCPVF